MGLEPLRDVLRARDLRAGVAVERRVALELAPPAADLPFEVALGLAEAFEPGGEVVDRADRRRAFDHREPHAVTHPRIARVRFGQAHRRCEPVDRLHQVEGAAEHLLVAAGGEQRRVWHRAAGERAQHARFPAHRLVAVLALVDRRTAQHVALAAALEAHEDVLAPARQQLDVRELARRQPFAVHPFGQAREIDALDRGKVAHHTPSAAPPSICRTAPVVNDDASLAK